MHDIWQQAIAGRWIRRGTARAMAIIIGVALIATACGSAPTVTAFNSQANSLCQTFRPRLRQIEAVIVLSSNGSESRLEPAISSALPQAEQGAAQLQALAQPNGEGAQLSKAFSSQKAQLQELKSLLTALKQGNADKIQSTETAFEESEAPLNQQFDVLGLTDCGSGSGSSSSSTG